MAKILLVISKFPPEYSGPGVRIPRLYAWLKQHGARHEFQVLCNGIEQSASAHYTHKEMAVERVGAYWTRRFLNALRIIPDRVHHSIAYQVEFVKTLLRLCFGHNYRDVDLVHIAGHSGGTAAGLLWAKITKRPVLLELVTQNAPHRQKFLFIFKTPKITAQKVVALTKDMVEKSLKTGLPEDQIWCRPNPIDEETFHPVSAKEKSALRHQLTPFNDSMVVLTSVAKLMPQKNQFLVIKALPHLPEHVVAVIAGPLITHGPLYERDLSYLEDMKKFITAHNLTHRVHIVTDFVAADHYMKASDIYMMPAWNEGFGTPMLEAMACGLPVVGNENEPAFREWIVDGKNGALCDIDKPDQWAKAINEIQAMSSHARGIMSAEIHERAGQASVNSYYRDIISNLLSGHYQR